MGSSGRTSITQVPKTMNMKTMFPLSQSFNFSLNQNTTASLRERYFPRDVRTPRKDHNRLILN